MEPLSAPPRSADEQLASLVEEVAQLRDLFQRRLLEDKAKNRLYDELCEQLTIARNGLANQLLTPLFQELLLIVDRVGSLSRDGDVVLDSVADELLELLGRREVRRVPAVRAFDPALHEAVRAEPRADQPPGTILEVLRPGYLLGGQLLRAERVVVAAASSTSPDATPDHPVVSTEDRAATTEHLDEADLS